MRIDIGTVLRLDPAVRDSAGRQWIATALEGWDGVPRRQSSLEPTGRHGTIPTEDLYGARTLVIEGTCKATSEADFWSAWNLIEQIEETLAPEAQRITVYETSPKYVLGSIGREPRMKMLGGSSFDFQLSFICHDPFKKNA